MWVRLLANWNGIRVGSILDVSEAQGILLISQGVAAPTSNPTIVAPATHEQAIKSKHETR